MKERVGLFVLICQAVQHAHLKGVVHRDLKPSNVLVTASDAVHDTLQVRVLDGLADEHEQLHPLLHRQSIRSQ